MPFPQFSIISEVHPFGLLLVSFSILITLHTHTHIEISGGISHSFSSKSVLQKNLPNVKSKLKHIRMQSSRLGRMIIWVIYGRAHRAHNSPPIILTMIPEKKECGFSDNQKAYKIFLLIPYPCCVYRKNKVYN